MKTFKYEPFLPNPFKIETIRDYFKQIHRLHFLGSPKINDKRYAESKHRIFTNLYIVMVEKTEIGTFKAGDDIGEIKWVPVSALKNLEDFEEVHHEIINIVLERCDLND